jgi:NAD(P)-dependent dehydrogenase (short-subunit alcohol dehydrogenase family)
MTVRFDDRVAIVTGAGNGLGRSHALALAQRGAKVVVNDVGGTRDGTGASSAAAEAVAEEIRAAGGEALADGADVTDFSQVEAMVGAVMARWGRVDVLVNNAGIIRDKSFRKMALEDFFRVMAVHVNGSVHCTKAVWAIMQDRGYGRVAMTTSSSGLYGNFGQANYGAAKMAVVGLMNTLAIEGEKYGIRVNTLAPCAATRMTEDLMEPRVLQLLEPEAVTAGLLHLVSEEAPNRTILAAGAGGFARSILYETPGVHLRGEDCSPEGVAAHWDEITSAVDQTEYQSGSEQTISLLTKAARSRGLELG